MVRRLVNLLQNFVFVRFYYGKMLGTGQILCEEYNTDISRLRSKRCFVLSNFQFVFVGLISIT